MAIHYQTVKDLSFLSSVVTDIDVIDRVLPDSDALVKSGGIYSAMQNLSSELVDAVNLDPVKDVKLFDFSELPSVQIEGIPATRNLVLATGDDQSTVFQVPGYDAGSQYFRIPSIVKLNSGRRLAIFDVRWQSHEDIGKTQYNDQCTGMAYSDDRGKTWSNPKAIVDWFYPVYSPETPGVKYQCGASDPGIVYDEENNVVMVFALGGYGYLNRLSQKTEDVTAVERQQLVFTYSKDDGATWSEPITVNDKIFDADGTGRSWAQQYAYLFSTCTAGLTLKHQPDPSNNGMVLPVQMHPSGLTANDWTKDFRIGLLKVRPTYDSERNIIDLSLTFAGESGQTALFGEDCSGANECSICEGPDGEIVMASRCYKWIDNPRGTFSSAGVSIRVSKAQSLGAAWTLVGDLETTADGKTDRACSSLETAAQTKPGLFWSQAMRMYVIGYVQALHVSGDIRTNLVLRCSSDLLNWNYLTKLEFKQGMGYITFVPQEDPGKFIECVYEAWNDGVNTNPAINGSSKQLKYFSLALGGNTPCRFTSASLDQGAINSSSSDIQGFSFRLSKANTTGPLSPRPLLAKPVAKMRIFWGAFTSSQTDIYAVIYDSNSADGMPVAYTDLMDLSVNGDIFVQFPLRQTVNIDTDHEYFVMFKKATTANPYPESLAEIPARGALGAAGNIVRVTTFCSKNQTDDYMKVYQAGSAKYTNSHPWFVYMDLLTD